MHNDGNANAPSSMVMLRAKTLMQTGLLLLKPVATYYSDERNSDIVSLCMSCTRTPSCLYLGS